MNNRVFIIAEAGVNHNGSIDIAKKMIDVASDSGADAVKFQTFKAEKVVIKNAPKVQYQKDSLLDNDSQYEMLKKLELDLNAHQIISRYCEKKKIIFLSTPFDHQSIDLLESLDFKIYKIPSGEITNLPYLRYIGSLSKKIILSTGMSSLKEVEDALSVLILSGTLKENITILHANTMYPTPMKDVNLKAMITMKNHFNISVGYSDHTEGIEVDIAAVAMGASVIEKHFTLDKLMSGPDHKASLSPVELKSMVKAIRNIEQAIGHGKKIITPSEKENIGSVRRSITASTSIKKGEVLTEKNISVRRPASGISPMKWDEIIGSKAHKNYKLDDLI